MQFMKRRMPAAQAKVEEDVRLTKMGQVPFTVSRPRRPINRAIQQARNSNIRRRATARNLPARKTRASPDHRKLEPCAGSDPRHVAKTPGLRCCVETWRDPSAIDAERLPTSSVPDRRD